MTRQELRSAARERVGSPERDAWGLRAGVALWWMLVAVAISWGAASIVPHAEIKVGAAPLFGHWDWRPGRGVVLTAGMAAALVWAGPRVASAWSWRSLLAASAVASAAWSVTLNVGAGWHTLTEGLSDRHQYEPFAASIDDVGAFLEGFVDQISGYPVHVRGHPPGATLVPWLLDRIGLGGAGWFALVIVAGWSVAVVATLFATRELAGEAGARRMAPMLVLLPGALWATSADGLFAGVGAIGVALATVAVARHRYDMAALAGAVFGLALMLTYGAASLLVLVVVVGLFTPGGRRVVPVVVVASATVCLVVVWVATGFSWLGGLEATRGEYWAGVAARRPTPYFTLAGNPGALAIALGPAVFAGLGALAARARRTRQIGGSTVLPLGALLAVALADASLLSKGEVERIWLLFMPWLATAMVALRPPGRWWLGLQAGVAIALAASFARG